MIKILDNGLKLMPSIDGIDSFLFDSSRAELSINYIKENNIKRVMLDHLTGFVASDLISIIPVSNLIQELVIASEKINYKGLEEFHNLTLLGALDNKKDTIDLNSFPNLVSLNCSITDRLKGLENCVKLKRLTISDYKSKTKDLSAIPTLEILEHLSLIKADTTTLHGVERYSNLKKLEIFSASKLEAIAALQALSGSLEEIQVEQCKKINDYETLGKVKSLKKIILSESGEIKSLAFVKELPLLEFISFWGTNVLDGNIKYCEGINYVGFDNKKHYTHKSEQFKK
ncbi:hypothetical protein SAMN05421780_102233 [Flexibacter flexilis DSM 6793]|uniref:Leucine Rich repeat-containing protein n=1 Tax=Flexibacter flexilis DSM 6793 TaxID=927664 RepID=A0A1I1FL15_9BACT|nr:hypothetical protein [Flexibacter flexilis]SFC00014.1 hypothetical protein SAMN05421780_102233 [Flexibacter flexilis DSM 6793]